MREKSTLIATGKGYDYFINQNIHILILLFPLFSAQGELF